MAPAATTVPDVIASTAGLAGRPAWQAADEVGWIRGIETSEGTVARFEVRFEPGLVVRLLHQIVRELPEDLINRGPH